MTEDQLVDRLAKPIYVLRMARPIEANRLAPQFTTGMVRSARTRAANARREIRSIVLQYNAELDWE